MLHQISDQDQFFAELQATRKTLQSHIETLCRELMQRENMNEHKVFAVCSQVDLQIREFSALVGQANSVRVDLENEAQTSEDRMNIRRQWGPVSAKINLFKVELSQWSLMRGLVQDQVTHRKKRIPLYDRTTELAVAQNSASDDVFDWLHAILNPMSQDEAGLANGYYPDIALSNSTFHQHLHAAYRVLLAQDKEQPIRFLDVGCGGGLKVLSALRYFQESHGLEFQQSYVDAASALLGRTKGLEASVFQADALTFEDYDSYDVIYFFKPIEDPEKLIELERRVVSGARPGTILIAPYVGFGARHADLGCAHVAGSVYLSKTSPSAAVRWRRRAEKTGTGVLHGEESGVATVWSPLLKASKRCGYDIAHHIDPT